MFSCSLSLFNLASLISTYIFVKNLFLIGIFLESPLSQLIFFKTSLSISIYCCLEFFIRLEFSIIDQNQMMMTMMHRTISSDQTTQIVITISGGWKMIRGDEPNNVPLCEIDLATKGWNGVHFITSHFLMTL